ncbi:MAG: AraC family transcriptional regulator ligand-binding domain-containing protein, partial [Spongiibacter sp.]
MNRYLERSAIPSSYVHLLYDYLAERGLDGEPALGQKRPATSARPGRFPVFEWSQLLQCAARQLDDPLLGLHLGQSISPRHLGIMGYVILACGNLGAALERLEHYQRLIYDVNP